MRILIDIAHPAHAHFFRYIIDELRARNHHVLLVTRNKEMTEGLLRSFNMNYLTLSAPNKYPGGRICELLLHWFRVWRLIKSENLDLAISISGLFTALPARLAGVREIMETDTEDARLSNAISKRFSRIIVTPRAYLHDLGVNHRRYNGYHELAYLHPNRFSADQSTLNRYRLGRNDPFWLLRTVNWGALHDKGEIGFTQTSVQALIDRLKQTGRVLISQETPVPVVGAERIRDPADVHHLLAFCRAYVGESPTMAMEAAILGRPAWLVSSRARNLGYIVEMEDRYGLIRTFVNGEEFTDAFEGLEREIKQCEDERADGRKAMLEYKIDVVAWFVDLIEEAGSN
jgi:predicted glycosyltransferase